MFSCDTAVILQYLAAAVSPDARAHMPAVILRIFFKDRGGLLV